MDRRTFDQRIEQLRQGEFVEDGSIFTYANDHLYELKRLLEALRLCCDWQKQKIQILKAMKVKVDTTLRRQKDEIERLSKLAETHFQASKKNTYNWVRVEDRPPEKSGEYYTFGTSLGVHTLAYSALHKMWNARDYATEGEAMKNAIDGITHWCEKPLAPDVSAADCNDSGKVEDL